MPLPVPLADLLGDRPESPAANLSAVDLDDGEDAAGGAAEEGFVGGVEIVRGEVALFGGDVELGRDLEDGLAGDPLQDAAAWRVERATAHEEDVGAATLSE